MIWALWDLESSNFVGNYRTAAEALAFVRASIKTNSNIDLGWSLERGDDGGTVVQVATGAALIALAMEG